MLRSKNIVIGIGIVITILLFSLPWLHWVGNGHRPCITLINGISALWIKGKYLSLIACSLMGLLPIIFAIDLAYHSRIPSSLKLLPACFFISLIIFALYHINIEMLIDNYGKVNYHFSIGYVLYIASSLFIGFGTIVITIIRTTKYNNS